MNSKIIKIKFISTINDRFCAIIWNHQKQIIFNNYSKNGFICFKANLNCVYKMMIISSLKYQKIVTFLVTEKTPSELIIFLNDYYVSKPHLITIKLTDRFYKNLPITKGKIILWNT